MTRSNLVLRRIWDTLLPPMILVTLIVVTVRRQSILDRGAKKSRWYSGSLVLC